MKYLIAYHDKCIDGFTAAWACQSGLIEIQGVSVEDISAIAVSYGDLQDLLDLTNLGDLEKLYVVDFSLPVDVIATIYDRNVSVTVIDHHKTAAEMYDITSEQARKTFAGAEIIYDINESGASLVWEYFYKPYLYYEYYIPNLINYVRDYDLWKFELPHTKEINMFLRVQPKMFTTWSYLDEAFEYNRMREQIIDKGKAIQAYHESVVQDIVETAEPITIDGKKGLVANCSPHFASDVGHVLATKSGTFGATWQQVRDKVKYSLRSNGDYDVAVMAQIFGGGGHKNAAGFTLNNPAVSEGSSSICLWTTEGTDGTIGIVTDEEGEYRGG